MHKMRHSLALLLLLSPLTAAFADDRPSPGLLWNKTGLPATFPLQVKTRPGADYIVTLTDTSTDTKALAAFIEGGRFFRVLVPPGTYGLHFDYGTVWHDDEQRFADAKGFDLQAPLTFEIRGIGRKAGHLVDLTSLDLDQETASAVQIHDQSLCRISRAEITPNCPLGDETCEPQGNSEGYTSPYGVNSRYDLTYNSYTRLCD